MEIEQWTFPDADTQADTDEASPESTGLIDLSDLVR